ncbi:MAG: DUF1491 family protein [Alphaproteobacteria bacterium]|nr:DUF1491 family protein [Alphaproteobacteria bacterium]
MTDDRIPTSLWLDAHLKVIAAQGIPYTVINKGAYGSGTVMVKIYAPGEGCLLLQQQRGLDGQMGWLALFKGAVTPEGEVDAYITRAVNMDPDLWVIEVEDREKRNPFEGKVF